MYHKASPIFVALGNERISIVDGQLSPLDVGRDKQSFGCILATRSKSLSVLRSLLTKKKTFSDILMFLILGILILWHSSHCGGSH